jgi:hypothetical protein
MFNNVPNTISITGKLILEGCDINDKFVTNEKYQGDIKLVYVELFCMMEEQRTKINALEKRIKELEK